MSHPALAQTLGAHLTPRAAPDLAAHPLLGAMPTDHSNLSTASEPRAYADAGTAPGPGVGPSAGQGAGPSVGPGGPGWARLRPRRGAPTVLAIAALGAGCSAVDSADLATHTLEARVEVTTFGGRDAQVSVQLIHAGGGPFSSSVRLTEGDALTAFGPVGARSLFGSGGFGVVSYSNSVTLDGGPARVRVALDRPLHDPAPSTVVDLPPPFEIDPGRRSTFDFDFDVIPISWSHRGPDAMQLDVSGWCIHDFQRHLGWDEGFTLIEPGMLDARSDWGGAPCELTVRLQRTRAGFVDPALAGGEAWGTQVRETSVWVDARY